MKYHFRKVKCYPRRWSSVFFVLSFLRFYLFEWNSTGSNLREGNTHSTDSTVKWAVMSLRRFVQGPFKGTDRLTTSIHMHTRSERTRREGGGASSHSRLHCWRLLALNSLCGALDKSSHSEVKGQERPLATPLSPSRHSRVRGRHSSRNIDPASEG